MKTNNAKEYLDTATPKGQRNEKLFKAACCFRNAGVPIEKAEMELGHKALRDGLTRNEVHKTVASAYRYSGAPRVTTQGDLPRILAPKFKFKELPKLPSPIKGGVRHFLRTAFRKGEAITIERARLNEKNQEEPSNSGTVYTRAKLLKFAKEPGGLERALKENGRDENDSGGIYFRINPVTEPGTDDAHVLRYRHILIEFDGIPLQKQWAIIKQSNLPVTAVLHSGGKSLHALVRVHAKTMEEYNYWVRIIYGYLAPFGVDTKNGNPSRFSRLPEIQRTEKSRQELLALKMGARSIASWFNENKDPWQGGVDLTQHIAAVKLSEEETYRPVTLHSTGYSQLDSLLGGGLATGETTSVFAPTSVGKSAFMANLALRIAEKNIPCAIVSLEMKKNDIWKLTVGIEARIFRSDMRTQRIETEKKKSIGDAIQKLKSFPITVIDRRDFPRDANHSEAPTMMAIEKVLSDGALHCGWKVVFIDYLAKIGPMNGEEMQRLSRITNWVCDAAQRLGLHIVVLAQAGKSSYGRKKSDNTRTVALEDVKGPVEVVADMDNCIGLVRPDWNAPEETPSSILSCVVLKARQGPTGTVELNFDKPTGRIEDNFTLVGPKNDPHQEKDAHKGARRTKTRKGAKFGPPGGLKRKIYY